MSDIKYWIKLIESTYEDEDEDDDRLKHADDPRISEFRRLLSLWGEGWANQAWGKPKLHQDCKLNYYVFNKKIFISNYKCDNIHIILCYYNMFSSLL